MEITEIDPSYSAECRDHAHRRSTRRRPRGLLQRQRTRTLRNEDNWPTLVDNHGQPSTRYPTNPNGSPGGVTGLCSTDSRATVMMPHPERVFRSMRSAYRPEEWLDDEGPWLRLFQECAHLRRYAGANTGAKLEGLSNLTLKHR